MITEAYRNTFAGVLDWVDLAKNNGLYSYEQPFDSAPLATSSLDGRMVTMLTTSNYLGLAGHPEIIAAMKAALDQYGPSACGARLNNGTTSLHLQLEQELAEWMGTESALLFSSGYMANLGAISALCDSDTVIITDQFNHMSILDGCRLAEGSVKIFAHNSMEKLEYVLKRQAGAAKKFVVVDGVYSMDGEIAPLDEIHSLTEQYGALLMVDEAHGVGVLGDTGCGAFEHLGARPDVVMGTFSKSLAGVGGFIAASADVIQFVRHSAHAYLFNASPPAVTIAGVLKALELLRAEPERQEKLWVNTAQFRAGLLNLGLEVMGSVTPVVPIHIGDDMTALRMTKEMLDDGLYVAAAIFPAVPKGSSRLRATVTAAMDDEDIDRALDILGSAAKRHGIIG
ncbi:pyridoxal phosphate-dependent aminotransferase family protein [Actinomadura sp. KC06]|uniref:aminotransferase class I/II-fold pyridoxal phosphate-dependent enzyme n=1 Tax=Actinomadura sp. KC06 TaxID=2530369 RepID=UPI001053E1F2|nr:pyridoxal phosphate-dependent aminotransferase family protein [Actinomadura sp. KC06]TDD30864.1 pyridoxal phosphate-dependent aminotransferase family protein [Actinomadura sp. KC06]